MIKHVVMFRFRDDVDVATRRMVRETFRDQILALRDRLSIIRSIEVGFNVNEQELWDICLMGEFDTLDDVRAYSVFPDHMAAAGALKPYLQGRSCVDYVV